MSGAAGTFFSRVLSRFQSTRVAAFPHKDKDNKEETVIQPAPPVPDPAVVTDAALPVTAADDPDDSDTSPVPPIQEPRSQKRSRAITTATDSAVSPLAFQAAQAEALEIKDPAREAVLIALEQDLLVLLNQTSFILVRIKRSPSASGTGALGTRRRPLAASPTPSDESENAPVETAAYNPLSAIKMGRETAQNIEGRSRGLLLETSLTPVQQDRIDRILQSAQDLLCALQAARYAHQTALLLPEEGLSGQAALPRLKRACDCVIEISSRVSFAIEGREGAMGAVAEQYRAFLSVKEETDIHFSLLRERRTLSQTARRLTSAALWSISVSAESMVKVAARFALPIETSRGVNRDHEKYKHLDRGDDLLSPLRRR